MQTGLDTEVTGFLGCERDEGGDQARPGLRIGGNEGGRADYCRAGHPRATQAGRVDAAFAFRLLGKLVTRVGSLESATIAAYDGVRRSATSRRAWLMLSAPRPLARKAVSVQRDDAVMALPRVLLERGLRSLMPVVTDGTRGFITDFE